MKIYSDIKQHLLDHQYTWLITGVAGFIGSNLLETLILLNQRIIGLDNFSTGSVYNLENAVRSSTGQKYSDLFTFVEGDISDFKTCKNVCSNVDFVLHQAALGSIPRSIEDPINTHKSNLTGFLNMLVASYEVEVRGFVYASSSSVYGDYEGLPKIENKIGNPINPYGLTKLVNEEYAKIFSSIYDYRTIGLRYFNVFGKRQNPEGSYAAVIPRWINAMLNEEKVFINGDGKTSRDFCYVENVIQINILSALTKNSLAKNNIYNVACGQQTTLLELYDLISSKIKKELNDIHIPQPTFCDYRPGDIRSSLADVAHANELLDYQSTHSLTEGIDQTIDWYIENHIAS